MAGPGLFEAPGNHYNPDGSIRTIGDFIRNRVVGPKAYVRAIAYSDDETYQHTFTFVLNRTIVGRITTPIATPGINGAARYQRVCFAVDTGLIRFARRIPNSTPTPGQNIVTVSGNGQMPPLQCEVCVVGAAVESITIEAMAPVILVHGILSNSNAFNQFDPVLVAAGIPTARVNLSEGPVSPIAVRELLPQVLQRAAEFGARHVHIVAHSKGGLWTREMMKHLTGVSVYSVTTLDTPHEGSVLADAWVLGSTAVESGAPTSLLRILLAALPQRTVWDLPVASLRAFNRASPLITRMIADDQVNRVEYYAHAADANVNGNVDPDGFGKIESSEETYRGFLKDRALYYLVQQHREATSSRQIPGGQLVLLGPLIPNSPPFPLNDFVVTTASAWCSTTSACAGMFKMPFPGIPWKKHHGSILGSDLAALVRNMLGVDLERRLSN
ncbi:MAG: hypothetical protein JST93_10105 [Acidobacteria bacterium]|nr:hypothetical protein [Acidobacteriota bacterium]